MTTLGPQQWKQLFDLLDTALDLPPPAREILLSSLAGSDEALKPVLAELLALHASWTGDALRGSSRQLARALLTIALTDVDAVPPRPRT